MIIRKRTCGRLQSQCKTQGFLLIEVMIAIGVFTMIGLLIQQQYASLMMRQYEHERLVLSLIQMRSLLEQRLQGKTILSRGVASRYVWDERTVVTDAGEVIPGCRWVVLKHGEQDMILTTIVLV